MTAMDTNAIERRLTEWRKMWPGGEWNIKVYSRGHINVYAWFGGRSFEQDFDEGDLTHKILSEVEQGLDYITKKSK